MMLDFIMWVAVFIMWVMLYVVKDKPDAPDDLAAKTLTGSQER